MTEKSALAHWIGKLAAGRVLVAGDVMLDHFVYGAILRISPEAPVPVFRSGDKKTTLGGAGNVARNLLGLGATVDFVSVVGTDTDADEINVMLTGFDRLRYDLVSDPSRRTTVKTRFVAGHQQILRVDSESAQDIGLAVESKAFDAVIRYAAVANTIVLSDYGKGFLTPSFIAKVVGTGRELGIPVLIDPKGTDYSRYKGAGMLTPNLKELGEATRMPIDSNEAIVEAARQLIDHCSLNALLVTRGAEGMSLVQADGSVNHFTAEAREVFDVSGAGDTVMAVLAAALGAGASLHDAARLANAAAGIVVGKVGTAVIHPQELFQAVHNEEKTGPKVTTLEVALDRIETWRRRGYRIGFTNGIFDLLHPGHITLLTKAASVCDRLVVGINGDDSAKSLRGGPPLQNEQARSTIVSSLEAVDLVVIFHDETPVGLLERLRPDVLIKGSNYLLEEVVGTDVVKKYGGEVFLVDLPQGQGIVGMDDKPTKADEL